MNKKPKHKISSKSGIIKKKNSKNSKKPNKKKYADVFGINFLQEERKFTQAGNAGSLRLINERKRNSRYNADNKHMYSRHMSVCQESQIINTSFIRENSIESDDPDYSRLSDDS